MNKLNAQTQYKNNTGTTTSTALTQLHHLRKQLGLFLPYLFSRIRKVCIYICVVKYNKNKHLHHSHKHGAFMKLSDTLLWITDLNVCQRWKQPTRCNNFRLLIFLLTYLNLLYMFRVKNSPIFRRSFDCIYRYCCWPVTRSPVSSNIGIYSQKTSWRWASFSPETCRADSNRSIKISINEKLLHLVGCFHRCSNDARSHKHQT